MINFRKYWVTLSLVFLFAGCTGGGQTAIVNVHVVPMTAEKIVKSQTILIKGDRIIKIEAADTIKLPGGCVIIEGNGAYLVPGLADMHMHTREDWQDSEWPVSPLSLFLANGVTTIRDFGPIGSLKTYPLRWREQIKKQALDGPAIYASGERLFASPLNDPAALVQWNHSQGFDFLKIYSYVSKKDFHAAMTKAQELNFYTAGHIPFPVGLDDVISAGMNEIAHIEELDFEFVAFNRDMLLSAKKWLPYVIGQSMRQNDMSKGFNNENFLAKYGHTLTGIIQKIKAADMPVCTTLSVGDTIIQKLFQPGWFKTRPQIDYLPQAYMASFLTGREKHQQQFKGIESLAVFKYELEKLLLKKLHRAGVTLLLSTDCGTGSMGIVPGFSIHDELRILVENGFTPYQALATGTVNAARVIAKMNRGGDFGTITVGNRADLILVKGNPLEDIGRLKNIHGVMAAGKWYAKSRLDEMIALK